MPPEESPAFWGAADRDKAPIPLLGGKIGIALVWQAQRAQHPTGKTQSRACGDGARKRLVMNGERRFSLQESFWSHGRESIKQVLIDQEKIIFLGHSQAVKSGGN